MTSDDNTFVRRRRKMISKYVFGNPINTEAVIADIEPSDGKPEFGSIDSTDGFRFTYTMGEDDIVYGLGENVRGINKRGYEYVSFCSDEPHQYEDVKSLYGAHNFIIVDGRDNFGLFIDYPSKLTFDIGFTDKDILNIHTDGSDLVLYVITGESSYDIVKQFRKIIGRSYIAPKFAFGFGQSRWGYKTKEDFKEVLDNHRRAHVPLDMIYMDIDYMDNFKDFTVNGEEFEDFPAFVKEMKDNHIHLVPIIDAGVKVEKGYDVYEEGVENGYFCKREDGSNFIGTVWPGETHFPDFLNPKAREWFGDKYKVLIDAGIDGFWNDMNEPAIFHTPEGLDEICDVMQEFIDDRNSHHVFELTQKVTELANNPKDYSRIYHNINGEMVCHDRVHNLYGYNMTRAAGEAFERICPDERILMFSRSSYVGMHRYAGIWTGDNLSFWSHLLMNLKMLPSLNMVGLMYTGADIGGFGSNTSRDLLLRWLALGVFTPLMRNHSADGTRKQEFFRFEKEEDFKAVINVRYRLLPYIYSEYMKAVLSDDMMFKPLGFVYGDDEIARRIEDQLMVGDDIMIAPVCEQNAVGRVVYLPENMKKVVFKADGAVDVEDIAPGFNYVKLALNEVMCFIREGHCIPVGEAVEWVDDLDYSSIRMIGYPGAHYDLYNDDGIHKDYDNPKNIETLVME